MPISLQELPAVFAAIRKPKEIEVPLEEAAQPVSVPKPFSSPVDWRDQWIYFLMVDRFNNPLKPPTSPWDRELTNRQGGTFEGIRKKLAYIKDLGAGAIWMTPVLKNRMSAVDGSYHGYGIMDFLEVDPRFGSGPGKAEEEFIRLVNEAHARGLYVILDVVINHTGDVFAYKVNGEVKDIAGYSNDGYMVFWRDERGNPRRDWPSPPHGGLSRDAGIWPAEFQQNDWFRRKGGGPAAPSEVVGDFCSLKEFNTDLEDYYHDKPVWNLLIRAYQYVLGKYDVDGFRVDTLKHVEREFALTFCNAIREFASSIGKKNFFIFGESKGDENKLAEYTGRYTTDEQGRTGADASLDFPLQWSLTAAAKGFLPPTAVEDVFNLRKEVHREKNLLSTHGDASRFFVTFLDNHDDPNRFLYPRDGGDYSRQLTMAIGCLFSLQGIPCIYYGTEQGLKGTSEMYAPTYSSGKPEYVREALWGKPAAFDQTAEFYREIQRVADIRNREPALRYGRQYFRQISGNNSDFGFSKELGGIIAFSRILNDREVLIVANTNVESQFSGWAVVDARLHNDAVSFHIAYSNHGKQGASPLSSGDATFYSRDGYSFPGWARRIAVTLAPMEIQMIAPEWMCREIFG